MKKVIQGIELENKIEEAITLLCDTVEKTLGPKGNNSIISQSNFSPFITNDGVTIAENIQSEDTCVSAILEIAKESSIKTNEVVGDGTTTTLVLFKYLYQLSKKYIRNGENPVVLKKELTKELDKIIIRLKQMAKPPTKKMLNHIASVSSGEIEIGKIVSEVIEKVDNKSAITVKEVSENKVFYSLKKGYTFPTDIVSFIAIKEGEKLDYQNPLILIINDKLNTLESLSMILNDILINKRPLVLIANEFDEYFINEIVAFQITNQLDIILLKIEEYGLRQRMIEQDIETISNATIIENATRITPKNLGATSHIFIQKDQARIEFLKTAKQRKYIEQLQKEEKEIQDAFDKEFYQKRIAMFQTGLAEIAIGGITKTECRERKMRLEDALCATSIAKKGVLPGGGLSLLQIAMEITNSTPASLIWKEVLQKPFTQILKNCGLKETEIKKKIAGEKYTILYNAWTENYEKINDTQILDPLNVIICALKNACSISTMLLTTNSLIINEYHTNLNKTNDYSEYI